MINKSKRLNILRAILYKYSPDQNLSAEDKMRALQLFENHPNWVIKKGIGVRDIQVIKDRWNKKGFIIKRIDGSSTDISIVVCANGYGCSVLQRIKNACRYHIMPEILKFKNSINFANYVCPITGVRLCKTDCHIDHYDLTFYDLFKRWIKTKSVEKLAVYLNDSTEDNVDCDIFTNQEIIADFVSFHNSNTKLRAVSRTANLSLLRGGKQNGS